LAKKTIIYNNNHFEIAYEILNPKATTACVILHGWGSNKNIMKKGFGSYLNEYKHIYIDLPGFGSSTTDVALTTKEYAKIIQLFLEHLHVNATIAIGHSFGGKVATLLNPELLVLVASAGVVVPKTTTTKFKIQTFKLLKNLGLSSLRNYFVASDAKNLPEQMYTTFKNVVDEDFSYGFSSFTNTALLFWGKNDTATPLETTKVIQKIIPKSTLYTYNGDHYFFLQHQEDIARKIREQYERI